MRRITMVIASGKYVVMWEKVGKDWKLADRHLESGQIGVAVRCPHRVPLATKR
jgi:hypothetical protein